MRSSRQKLKFLRSLGNCPNNIPSVVVVSTTSTSSPLSNSSSTSPEVVVVPSVSSNSQQRHLLQYQQQQLQSPSRNNRKPISPPRSRNNSLRHSSESHQQGSRITNKSFNFNRSIHSNSTTNITNSVTGISRGRRIGEENRIGRRVIVMETITNGIVSHADYTPNLLPEVRVKAFNICRDYLHGVWKQINLRDLVVKRISGGLSNYLYHCSLPLTLTPIGSEPSQVLLRFYGQIHGEDALESLITESVIFALLSERKLGPRLYGIFPGGRIEQFLPARPLLTHELSDPKLSALIAQKMAQIHALNIPISKEASWLWGTMDRWMGSIREQLPKIMNSKDGKNKEIIGKISKYNLQEELKWLRSFLPSVGSPVVFSHNDLQEGNILLRPQYETIEDELILIDFEYCSYNYRGFDLANHFCEWSYNYQVETYPNFSYTPTDLPSEDEKIRFIRNYIQIMRTEYEQNFPEREKDFYEMSPLFNENHIQKEVDAFILASHFFWTLWAIVNGQVSKIPFGYWEYGLCRLETYFDLKKKFT